MKDIKIDDPYYYTSYSKGTYKGHRFMITDINGEVFVLFDDYVDVDSPTYMEILGKIQKKYTKNKK